MLLRVPYIFPGKVKQITPKGDSSEVILALENSTLEITVLVTAKAMAALALKNGVPAYAAILWLKGATLPGKNMVNVQAANKTWVTIPYGPATEAQITAARARTKTDHGTPSDSEEEAWSYGYLDFEDLDEKIQETMFNYNDCAPCSSVFQIETIRYPDGTWVTIPYSTECAAKILNAQERFENSTEKPSPALLEAWSHGYSSLQAFSEAPGSFNGFRVDGPTLAGFVYTGQDREPDLFVSKGLSAGANTCIVPVNLYIGPGKIGQAQVTAITP
jgi:molybdopterin-binding protein